MKKEYYCRQKFLWLSNFDEIDLEQYKVSYNEQIFNYTEPPNLFDVDKIERSVLVSELDSKIDTEKDFNNFVAKIKFVDSLCIINDRKKAENPIYKTFSEKTLKSYIWQLKKRNITAKLA